MGRSGVVTRTGVAPWDLSELSDCHAHERYWNHARQGRMLLLVDLDGVVYRGSQPVPGVAAVLSARATVGDEVVYVTNSSMWHHSDFVNRLQEEGKVRAIGLSNFYADLLERCERVRHVDSLQPPLSLISRDAAVTALPWCVSHGTGVIVYSPMGIRNPDRLLL